MGFIGTRQVCYILDWCDKEETLKLRQIPSSKHHAAEQPILDRRSRKRRRKRRKAVYKRAPAEKLFYRAEELCESGGGRPGLPVPNIPCGLCGRTELEALLPTFKAFLQGPILSDHFAANMVGKCLATETITVSHWSPANRVSHGLNNRKAVRHGRKSAGADSCEVSRPVLQPPGKPVHNKPTAAAVREN